MHWQILLATNQSSFDKAYSLPYPLIPHPLIKHTPHPLISMPRQISKSSAASRNDIQTRPTSSKRIENTRGANVAQPANKIKPRNQLTTALLNVERTWQRHPIQASVKLIKHGEMASYGHEARLLAVDYSPSPPTLELSLRDGKLYVELFAFQSGTSKSPGTTPVKLATFHYVADGRYQLSVRLLKSLKYLLVLTSLPQTNVFRIGKRIVIYKYDKQAKTDVSSSLQVKSTKRR